MKTCNNCNTKNEVTAVKCIRCNMPGNFTLHAVPTDARPAVKKQKLQCVNCGSHEPGFDIKCRHCNFPMSQEQRNEIAQLKLQRNKRVG